MQQREIVGEGTTRPPEECLEWWDPWWRDRPACSRITTGTILEDTWLWNRGRFGFEVTDSEIFTAVFCVFRPWSPKIEAVDMWHCGQVKLSLRDSQVRVAPACSSLVPRTWSVAWETCPKAPLEPQSITRQWNSTSSLVTSVSLVLLFSVLSQLIP